MSYIHVTEVSLRFPLMGAGLPVHHAIGAKERSSHFVYAPSGRAVAVNALSDVSFDVENGDRLAVIGKNGSGKSTLLYVLAGLLPPDRGVVTLSSQPSNLININLGMEQEANAKRNIMLRGLAAGYSRAEIIAKQQDIEEFSGLGEFLNVPFNTLSAGMRMRLNFAIATAFDADILILDEWLSAGDAEFQKKAALRMQQVVSVAGIVVMASHGKRMIEDVCNKCLWLDDGRVRMLGATKEVMAAYETEMGKPR